MKIDPAIHRPTLVQQIKPYQDVAKGMEQQFVELMVAQMRKSVDQNEPDNSETAFYKSLQDSEIAGIASGRNSIGLQKMILENILPEHLKREYLGQYKKIGRQNE